MRRANSFAAKLINWELIRTNIRPHLDEMPHVQPLLTELEGVITEARELDSIQEVARGQLRDLTRRRQEVEQRGEKLRSRLAAHLKGSFGFSSEQLIQFGINPRPRVVRRKKPGVPVTPPEIEGGSPAKQ
jgi:hypothetical protein